MGLHSITDPETTRAQKGARQQTKSTWASDSSKESFYIYHVDACDEYGASMSEAFPDKALKFEKGLPLVSILQSPGDTEVGYDVEADFEFQQELHTTFDNPRLAPNV